MWCVWVCWFVWCVGVGACTGKQREASGCATHLLACDASMKRNGCCGRGQDPLEPLPQAPFLVLAARLRQKRLQRPLVLLRQRHLDQLERVGLRAVDAATRRDLIHHARRQGALEKPMQRFAGELQPSVDVVGAVWGGWVVWVGLCERRGRPSTVEGDEPQSTQLTAPAPTESICEYRRLPR